MKNFRLYRQNVRGVEVAGLGGLFRIPGWKATSITFKALNEKGAMKKANKFWQDGEFGMGSICVREE